MTGLAQPGGSETPARGRLDSRETEGDRDYYDGRPVGPHHFCEEFVEVRSDPWAGAYCKLLAGHDGPHQAYYPEAKS